jgi:hypothetical protein
VLAETFPPRALNDALYEHWLGFLTSQLLVTDAIGKLTELVRCVLNDGALREDACVWVYDFGRVYDLAGGRLIVAGVLAFIFGPAAHALDTTNDCPNVSVKHISVQNFMIALQ